MFRRIIRSVIVLAVIVAAYRAYTLLAVPQMEPSLAIRDQRILDKKALNEIPNGVTKYQLLLSNYFPKDHWSQLRPPKVIANSTEKAMLVFDDFKRRTGSSENADGNAPTLVDIERIALLIFPTPFREGIAPPRDAIILEAPQGAHLEFDDFRPEAGHIGQITQGEFPGLIRIHSDMREEGPQDDLLIETADLHMNTKLMYSSAPVRFRKGASVGGGRELEIRFLADEHLKPNDPGLKISGIDSLEIRREVKMRLELDTRALLPGGRDADAKSAPKNDATPYTVNPTVQVADASAVTPVAKPPVEVSCSGPFTFDFVRYVASLDRDVEVRQVNPSGPSDQLVCTRLDIHFAPKLLPNGAPQPVVDPGKRQQNDLGKLEPAVIVAEGHPVVMTSPAKNMQARGDRIQIALREQRVRISGGSDAMLVSDGNILQAPVIDYQHPARDETTTIGRFRATGPGTLHYVSDPKSPEKALQAEWQTSVQLGREKGQPVLALDGRPKIAFGASGAMTADQIRMYMRELEGEGTEGIAIGGKSGDTKSKLRLAPDRLIATGRVEIDSPQFIGHTQQLSAAFRVQPEAAIAAVAGAVGGGKADKAAASSGGGLFPGMPGTGAPDTGAPQQKYSIDADQIRLDVLMKGQTAVPTGLACEGHIVLREQSQTVADQLPMEIRGGQLTVDHLDTKTPHVTLRGADAPVGKDADGSTSKVGGPQPGRQLAQLAGRGVTVLTDVVELDGKENRLWSDGPGKATMQVTRGFGGNAATPGAPVPLDLQWDGGLRFDGSTITFERDVSVAGMEGKLHCDQLSVKLSAPIKFGEKFDQANINPNEIECRGQVTIENVTRDTGGVASHELMQLARLTINQQTGAISGDGPGIIRSTRFGTNMGALAGQPGAPPKAAAVAPANAAGNKLYFLRVDFQRGLDGNMYTRELSFHNRVRTVYGPVDSWEQELDMTRPETLPPDSITMSCEELRLNEDAVAVRAMPTPTDGSKRPMGPIQMQAQGDVRIQGQVPSQGEFIVQADRASYDKAKETFILEGNSLTPAKLWRRSGGGNAPPTEARKIRYIRTTGDIRVDEIKYFEFTPNDLQNARRPTPVK